MPREFGPDEEALMELHGVVQNGVVVIDPHHSLPDGTKVTIVVEKKVERDDRATLRERLLKLAGTVDDLPTDMARSHDHYVHGTPKR